MRDIKAEKAELRQQYLKIRRAIPKETKAEYDSLLCRSIINSASYKYYDTILLYAAREDEPDLSALAEKALSDGKRVAYPRCVPGERAMNFHFIGSTDQLTPGSFGIYEPSDMLPVFDPASPCCSVCFIPAVLVDRSGYRIGYGGGYYDRFLSGFHGSLAAVAFSQFVINSVPHGIFDLKADVIITEGGITAVVKN